MNKALRITLVILLAFTLASLAVYRFRVGQRRFGGERNGRALGVELRTAQGQVSMVDEGSGTLIVSEGSQSVTFAFDDRTAIVQSGQSVKPSAIPSGARATVKYTHRSGRNWASRIEITTSSSRADY